MQSANFTILKIFASGTSMACADEVDVTNEDELAEYHSHMASARGQVDPQLSLAREGKKILDTDKYQVCTVRDVVSSMRNQTTLGEDRFTALDFPTLTAIDQRGWTRFCSDNLTARVSMYGWRWDRESFGGIESPFRRVASEEVKHAAWGILTPQQVVTTPHVDADGAVAVLRAPRNGCKIVMIFKPKGVREKSVEEAAKIYDKICSAASESRFTEVYKLAHVGVVVLEPSGAM
jgi:hypothetical protein